MNARQWKYALGGGLIAMLGLLPACGGGGSGGGAGVVGLGGLGSSAAVAPPVKITVTGPSPVSYWNEVAANTINVPAASTGSPAEQRPTSSVDLATVHVAIYDAAMAITGTHRPYAVTTVTASGSDEASQEAAIGAAAYGVLIGLFPNRTAQYQAAYDSYTAGIANGDAKARGLVLGAEVARGILALRANDGRSVALAPYVPGTTAGRFRGSNPVNRYAPFIKPFSLTSAAQFRVPAPPALDSALYAQDFNETRTLGDAVSSTRTDAQLEVAKFHTEPPPRFWPRNLRRFAMTDGRLADHARLMAMLFVAQADAEIACFESKYFYEFWRPQSAIPLGETDGNAATTADPAWKPVVPTPNHPEYPAAHACVTGALTEALKAYYATDQIAFSFDSTVTGSTHVFDSTAALVQETREARIFGGMHFRSALLSGDQLGVNVGRWVVQHNFQPR
ncbi:hypothetical protein ACSFA8_22995 [Variovorax sp. RT4R15]|uniref:vanadium-dependent haloperoxidase n=1 Tax=Variovorax sp. RT4R15 TaxID=3443737 RepID=UPI003F454162